MPNFLNVVKEQNVVYVVSALTEPPKWAEADVDIEHVFVVVFSLFIRGKARESMFCFRF